MIWPLTFAGSGMPASYFGVPTGAGRPPIFSMYLSRSGLAASLVISGSVPTQKRSGLESAFGVARRISRSPGAALAAMETLIITVSIIAGLEIGRAHV